MPLRACGETTYQYHLQLFGDSVLSQILVYAKVCHKNWINNDKHYLSSQINLQRKQLSPQQLWHLIMVRFDPKLRACLTGPRKIASQNVNNVSSKDNHTQTPPKKNYFKANISRFCAFFLSLSFHGSFFLIPHGVSCRMTDSVNSVVIPKVRISWKAVGC